jgi:hypothetical protein
MNNLYHKTALACVGIALSLAVGTNKEAKAATFTLTSTGNFLIVDNDRDELGDWYYGGVPLPVGIRESGYGEDYFKEEYRAFYDFNFANLSLTSNTVISSVILQTNVVEAEWYGPYFLLSVYGVNQSLDLLDNVSSIFNEGTYLDGKYLGSILRREPVGVANFNVLPFINKKIKNNEAFARFGIRNLQSDRYGDDDGYITINRDARLIIKTEPVPEPTTILGSAIGLCLGGWLKRKKSSQQNKTTPH